MGALLEWIDDVLRMMDNSQCFENPKYGNKDRTDEFLKNIGFR